MVIARLPELWTAWKGGLLRLGVCQFSFQMLMIAIIVYADFLVLVLVHSNCRPCRIETEKNEGDVAKLVEDGPLESAAIQSEETPSGVDVEKE
ncbi:hypothetical protein LWI28_005782 [Acer negundo]|uniref:Uncharacterized protein n=1 Tax=Acer negundo TaxID=4023 RepID=A0AAD5ILF8_ACENE|nr:hypothetical protein LWI28_005782 [Acer negundo]